MLADRIGVAMPVREPDPHTPLRRRHEQQDRVLLPTKSLPLSKKLGDKQSVLPGKWSKPPDGNGLLSGKKIVKELIEKHGGKVTSHHWFF
jgi:hypothetical protein